jgi:hypothetical protein
MKTVMTWALMLGLGVALVGCGGGEDTSKDKPKDDKAATK